MLFDKIGRGNERGKGCGAKQRVAMERVNGAGTVRGNGKKDAEQNTLEKQNQHLCKHRVARSTLTNTHAVGFPIEPLCNCTVFHLCREVMLDRSALETATPCCTVKLLHGPAELD